jgi:hypothetical protein
MCGELPVAGQMKVRQCGLSDVEEFFAGEKWSVVSTQSRNVLFLAK